MNIIYSNPIVENNSMALLFSKILKPKGPIITPEIINPIMPGMFILRKIIGAKSITKSISEKTKTGFVSGNSNSCAKSLKKSFILVALIFAWIALKIAILNKANQGTKI